MKAPTPLQRRKRAHRLFFGHVGSIGRASRRCEQTLPLFPLWLILDADGTLATELKSIVARTQA